MRRVSWIALMGAVVGSAWSAPARAQVNAGVGGFSSLGIAAPYAAPGLYGTTYGVPSYGSIRTYSEFSSPYGAGYGYGYAPYAILPGYGMGLWRPGYSTPGGYIYGGGNYNTFAAPYQPYSGFGPVPVGAYAPAFGPPFLSAYGNGWR